MSTWTPAQRAMLREMGITLWATPEPTPSAPPCAPVVEVLVPKTMAAATGGAPVSAAPPVRPVHEPAPEEAATRARTVQTISMPVAPVSGPASALDWPALEAAVQSCEACALSRSRRHTVFGVGHRQADWMLVGEAPGEQEDLQGEPFVGKAGQLLDQMLRAVGLTRSEATSDRQVYIANVLKCRPPANRNPDPQEVLRCQPYLQRQIELVQPRLILALGRFAVQSLLGSAEPIGRLRGRVHHHQGVPVVVTYHPAYLLRNPLDKARAWEDLCLAAQVHREGGRLPAG